MEYRKHPDQESCQKQADPYHIYYENYLDTNACTECTGLMPAGVQGREEWDTCREVFDFFPKAPASDNKQTSE